MKIETKILILFLSLNLLCYKCLAQKTENKNSTTEIEFSETKKDTFPKPIGIINDYGQLFTESQEAELTKILFNYNIETTRQIVVVTVNSISPYNNIQKYATDLGNNWGVGTANKNNGLAIVVCKPCKKIGIATGRGIEITLTDEVCTEVIEKNIIPKFKRGEFYNGIKSGITELIVKWK